MFRKVFKYDLIAQGRLVLLFIPLVWFLSAAAALLIRLMNTEAIANFAVVEIVSGIAVFFSLLAVGCFPLAVVIFCLRRYYTHFFSDEGYLTFTLPVKRETLLWSKTLSAFLILLLAGAAEIIAGGLFLLLLPDSREILTELWEAASFYLREPAVWPALILGVLTGLAAVFGEMAAMHFSLTQGQILAKKHRLLASFGVWYGISFLKRLISQGLSFIFLFGLLDDMDTGDGLSFNGMGVSYVYLSFLLLMELISFFLFYFWNLKIVKTKLALV